MLLVEVVREQIRDSPVADIGLGEKKIFGGGFDGIEGHHCPESSFDLGICKKGEFTYR